MSPTLVVVITLLASFWIPLLVIVFVVGLPIYLAIPLAFLSLGLAFEALDGYERKNPRG